jgi:hypothetical protein
MCYCVREEINMEYASNVVTIQQQEVPGQNAPAQPETQGAGQQGELKENRVYSPPPTALVEGFEALATFFENFANHGRNPETGEPGDIAKKVRALADYIAKGER